MTHTPLVSVLVLTKNRAALLARAFASVRAQTFTNYEVVVVNDGSTDATLTVIETWQRRLQSITVITHKESVGTTKSRQEGLQRCQGLYVALLDDDDEWVDAEKLAKQVSYIAQYPSTVLVGGGMQAVSDAQERTVLRPESDVAIRRTMLLRNNFFTSTVLFQRVAALHSGGFVSDGVEAAEDYDLWLRMGAQGKLHNFPDIFVRYRSPRYTAERYIAFLRKQLRLIAQHRKSYPHYGVSVLILAIRIILAKMRIIF